MNYNSRLFDSGYSLFFLYPLYRSSYDIKRNIKRSVLNPYS